MEDTQTPQKKTTEEKLDEIVLILEQMNRRDRARMTWGVIHGFLALIPLLILIWSTWYLIAHGAELINMITEQTVKQMTGGFGGGSSSQGSMIDELMKQLQGVQVR